MSGGSMNIKLMLLVFACGVLLIGCGSGGSDGYIPIHISRITVVGDSIIYLWQEDGTFPKIWANRGVPGDNVSGVLKRIGEIIKEKPSEIVLAIGTNDLSENGVYDFSLKLGLLINIIKESDIKLTVVSILPRLDSLQDYVGQYNTAIKGVCDLYSVDYFDISGSFYLPDGSVNSSLFENEVHPNHEGFVVMTSLYKKHWGL
jgi:lysophospholipase L1-like esterase